MTTRRGRLRRYMKANHFFAGGIFVLTLLVFWCSPIHQITDSNYSMMLSQSLLDRQTFALEHYAIPRLPLEYHDHTWKNGHIHQIQVVGEHFYYYMPPGSSVLSLPFVAVMNRLDVSAVNPDGSYNALGEMRIETSLAALLMAALSAIFFLLSRLLLPTKRSLMVALGSAFGTQVWSTASRALWADTWGMLLSGIVIYILLAQETGKLRIKPMLLATLLAWMYFVRPTYAVSILAITIYIALYHRRLLAKYLLVGGLWLLGFVAYSWSHYHSLLPQYFMPKRLRLGTLGTAVAGNLVSPSRGLLLYVPVLIFIIYILIRYREQIVYRKLLILSVSVIVGFLLVVSGFQPWWAGASYGPRYTAPLVPWFVLLAVIGMRAMIQSREQQRAVSSGQSRILERGVGTVLLALSVLINGIGAVSVRAWTWNAIGDIDHDPQKVWNWRHPQALAAILRPPLPRDFPVAPEKIDLSKPESQNFLWYGWSGPEPGFRWTDGKEATMIFAGSAQSDAQLQIKMAPFLVAGRLPSQRLALKLNGKAIGNLNLESNGPAVYRFELPATSLTAKNVLTFQLPDAASPSYFNMSGDERQLGIAVSWIVLQPAKQDRQL